MTFGSLFAGIGGIDLGLERAGMKCVWQVEIDVYARKVLEKHWPNVRRWDDVRTFPPEGEWGCDLIAGGFPCQDISNAGKMDGINGKRSGLWAEFVRVIRILRPENVLIENVAALTVRGLGRVLGDLAALGFDAEWTVLPAACLGAPYERNRLFVFAYPDSKHGGTRGTRRSIRVAEGLHLSRDTLFDPCGRIACEGHWATEPDLVRLVRGIPPAVDRLRGLGNAVVPQVAEWIGRRIMETNRST